MEQFIPEHHDLEPIEEVPKGPVGRFIEKYWKPAFAVFIILLFFFWVFTY